jgi:protein ImuB
MALQLAKALIPTSDVYYEPFDPVRDIEALRTLALWFLRFSPHVGIDLELHKAEKHQELRSASHLHYGIILDVTGTERLHGDFSSLSSKIYSLFKGSAHVALSPTLSGSWALSRFATQPLSIALSIPALRESVSNICIKALRIDDDTCELLQDVGIGTIGELLELPRHTLADRFGKQLLCRITQLTGSVEERFHTVSPEKRHIRSKIFEPPLTSRHAIMRVIERLFAEVISSLKKACSDALLFFLTLRDTSGHSTCKEFTLASATNDLKHVITIIQPIIDSMQFCGELREITLEGKYTSRKQHEQTNLANAVSPTDDIARSRNELLNAFCVRIGKERISYAYCANSHIPENSFEYRSALDSSSADKKPLLHQSAATYGLLERPPALITPPEPISTIAMLPDKPPSWVRWRDVGLSVIAGYGPERIAPEWWRVDLQRDVFADRDYFTIQDSSGRWLWIFRNQHSQEWFLHGVWS